jgi:cold shock CspA family protein
MKAYFRTIALGALAFALLVSITVFADTIRGTWSAELSQKHPDQVQLNLYRASRHSQMGHSIALSQLQGLESFSVNGAKVPVKFRLVRDAGTIEFDGTFNQGLGHGEFTFTANPDYISAMKQMGFPNAENKTFELAMLDVSQAYTKEFLSLGFNPDLDDLIKGRIFNVNREQVDGLKAVGATGLSLEKLVQYRIFNVNPEYVREMRAAYPSLSLEKLVEMRIHKATPEFAKEMANLGYANLDADQLIAFRIHGVTPEFIREIGEMGFKNLDADQLVQFRVFGVNAEQIKELATEGYTHLHADQLVQFRIHHIDNTFIEKVKRAGYKHPSPDQLVEFKILGIRVREADL